jgi:hypothetical protein
MRALFVAGIVLLTGCNGSGAPDAGSAAAAVSAAMRFDRAAFFDAPFPSDDLLVDGKVKLDRFPNPAQRDLIVQSKVMLAGATGFSLAGGVFFALSGAPGPLPALADTTTARASVFLLGVDSGARTPVEVSFSADGTNYGPQNLLAVVPLQGVPLQPRSLYAAVVLRRLGDASGRPLAQAPEVAALAAGTRPPALPASAFASYQRALAAVRTAGVDPADIAAFTAFTTGDPTAEAFAYRDDVLARPLPRPGAFTAGEVFAEYCVYKTTIDMPDYQTGTPPYVTTGGGWGVDASGKPAVDHMETANLVVTIPRAPMPEAGYPLTVFVNTGGGGARPLVDRVPEGPGHVPIPGNEGTGPALHLARAGFAGLSVDGPLDNGRNTTHGDEQFLVFNVTNGFALRDNVRQSALELALMAHLVDDLRVDASACPGAAPSARFDSKYLALMGHSTGAWIAQLVLALEPRYHAAIFSGAGSSWIANILYKQEPVPVRPFLSVLLGEIDLAVTNPGLTLVEWAAEPADPQVYDALLARGGPAGLTCNLLMEQGIVDHYIMPRIANSTSLALRLDLGGSELDTAAVPTLPDQLALGPLLGFSGGAPIALPAGPNRGSSCTALVVQHPEDGVEDGHEMLFQTDPPKHEYRCFLSTWRADGVPRVPVGAHATDPCP